MQTILNSLLFLSVMNAGTVRTAAQAAPVVP